jgi:hypothetical protein
MNRSARSSSAVVVEMTEGQDSKKGSTAVPNQDTGSSKPLPRWKRFWRWTEFGEKSGWEYLQLLGTLAIPVVIFVGTLVFTARQNDQQQLTEKQRAQAERELAEQQAQDEALQAYLDQMGQLMLDRKLLEAEQIDPVHTLAQARTSTAILRLDAEHNQSVIRFLSSSGLLGWSGNGKICICLLSDVALENAKLSHVNLQYAELSFADLKGADLSRSVFFEANLSHAVLWKADLSGSTLRAADLTLANLISADLSGADLTCADLSGALGITNEELDQQGATLQGATMPDGQKYEDWLKRQRGQQGGRGERQSLDCAHLGIPGP